MGRWLTAGPCSLRSKDERSAPARSAPWHATSLPRCHIVCFPGPNNTRDLAAPACRGHTLLITPQDTSWQRAGVGLVIVYLRTGHKGPDNALGPGTKSPAVTGSILHVLGRFGGHGRGIKEDEIRDLASRERASMGNTKQRGRDCG